MIRLIREPLKHHPHVPVRSNKIEINVVSNIDLSLETTAHGCMDKCRISPEIHPFFVSRFSYNAWANNTPIIRNPVPYRIKINLPSE